MFEQESSNLIKMRLNHNEIYIINVIVLIVAWIGREGVKKTIRKILTLSPAVLTSLGTSLEMKVLRYHPRPTAVYPQVNLKLSSLRRTDLDKK